MFPKREVETSSCVPIAEKTNKPHGQEGRKETLEPLKTHNESINPRGGGEGIVFSRRAEQLANPIPLHFSSPQLFPTGWFSISASPDLNYGIVSPERVRTNHPSP